MWTFAASALQQLIIKIRSIKQVRVYLPSLHELVLNVAALEEPCRLESLEFGGLLDTENFVKNRCHFISLPQNNLILMIKLVLK